MKARNMNLVYLLIALGGFLQGYLTSVIAGVLPFMANEFGLNDSQQGIVSSIVIFGGVLGALSFGKVATTYGRKRSLLILVTLCTIGILGASVPQNFIVILVFRFIMGMSIGAIQGLVPIYLSEISPSAIRGRVSSLSGILPNVGFLMAYIVNFAFFDTGNWRMMNLVCLIVTVTMLLGGFMLPESPEWLMSNGKLEEARKTALMIYDEPDVLGESEKEAISEENEEFTENKREYSSWMLKPLLLCIFIVTFQKFVGANAVLYYAPRILNDADLPGRLASFSTIGIGIVLVVAALICQQLVDRLGRKFLALLGNGAMGILLLILGLLPKVTNVPSFITVILLFAFIGAYAMTWSSIPWILMGEMLPTPVKGVGGALSTGGTWLADAMITLVFPITLGAFGIENNFLFFAILNVFCFVLLKKYLFETKGKTQNEIEYIEKTGSTKKVSESI